MEVPLQKLRIGFIGAGIQGQCAHLKNYATLPDCEVVAIAELRPSLRERVAARYSVPRTYASHREMLASERLDGIVAVQWFQGHGQIIPELLEAGVPLFTEKPLASSVEAGERIVAALCNSGTWHMVGYHKRSDPATMYVKAEIDRLKQTGELGKLRYVRILMPEGDYAAGGRAGLITTDEPLPAVPTDPAPSDMDEDTFARYVELVNYYIHQINLMRHLLGEPYEVIYADPSGVLMVIQSASGVAGTIEMSPYRTTLGWEESVLVAFEHGYIKLELPAPLARNRPGIVHIMRDPGDGAAPQRIEPTLPWIDAMRQQAMIFLRAIRGQTNPPCDAQEALEDLRVARQYLRLARR